MNTLQQFEQDKFEEYTKEKQIDTFAPGDTVKVSVRIIEGTNERIQAFEGVCIARKNAGLRSTFTVRKISHGEGVERVFPISSPRVEKVEVIRRGAVRRAKLYYLRGRTGKAARITEKKDYGRSKAKAEKAAAAKK